LDAWVLGQKYRPMLLSGATTNCPPDAMRN
jgi:hypothetical protein